MVLAISSCKQTSPSESIINVIDSVENNLYSTKSLKEVEEIQYDMLRQITDCLNSNHNGYRFVENEEEYNKVMERLKRYNYIYCIEISRFNPELNPDHGDRDKLVRVLALLERMENSALTKLDGFNPSSEQSESKVEGQNIYPTQSEIENINAKLPVLVAEGTLFTKVEYDDRTKVQTFYYRFTQELNEDLITTERIQELKSNMVSALKEDANNLKRLKAGMVFLYVYYSIDNTRLYEIKIDSNDIE